jgi:quinol monooxygenase YgiN
MKTFKPVGIGGRLVNHIPIVIITLIATAFFVNDARGQGTQMVRLAKIKVDPAQLENYHKALKEQMSTAIRLEKGVLTYYAVADKEEPSNITILEIYADSAAYKSHIETAHFKKYKETVKNMVKSLKLVDVTLIGVARKPGM